MVTFVDFENDTNNTLPGLEMVCQSNGVLLPAVFDYRCYNL